MDKMNIDFSKPYVRGCEWVEGTNPNDGMICMTEECLEFVKEEHAYYRIEDFVETLPKPLRFIVRPFITKFEERYMK